MAVIMDGNGRWAESRGLPASWARAGVEALEGNLGLSGWGIAPHRMCLFHGELVKAGDEVNFLMTLFERVLQKELRTLEAEQVRIRFLGDLDAPLINWELIGDATERCRQHRHSLQRLHQLRRPPELVRRPQRLARQAAKEIFCPKTSTKTAWLRNCSPPANRIPISS